MATIDYKQKIKDYMNSSEVDTLYKSMLNNLFPELKENKDKDEKTRKSLIILLQHFCKGYRVPGLDFPVSYKDMLAWLEKQGEHSNFLSKIQVGDKVTRNEDGVLVNLSQLNRVAKKQGEEKSYASETMNEKGDFDNGFTRIMEKEQEPAWSEEDERERRYIENELSCLIADEREIESPLSCRHKDLYSALYWLKSLKDRCLPQPQQEWSEEDEGMLQTVINRLELSKNRNASEIPYVERCIEWLKSLRPQNRWKPSDEHYELEEFAKIVRCNLTGISKAVQKLFEAKYLQLTGNKMYGGFKD